MRSFRRQQIGPACPGSGLLPLAWVAAASLLGLTVGCQRSSGPPQAAAPESPDASTLKVGIVRPERKTVRRPIKRPGYNIEPYQSTAVYARISGYVGKWHFDLGDRVRKGEVLAELSVPEMEVELRQKEAAVLQAEAEILQAKAARERAQAEHDRTKSQYQRLTRVGQSGVLDRENVEETRLGFEAARAGLSKAEADVKVGEARLKVARQASDYARTMLAYAKIRAPFDGVVTQRNVTEGNFVQPALGRKGEAIFVVDQVDPVRVFVNVPELEAVWISDGAEATVRSEGPAGQELKGTVTRTARSLDPATRTLRTEIDLPNPKGALLPGTYVDVTVVAERRRVWALPASAVVTEREQSYCFRVENGKAVRTALRLGLRGDKLVEVLKKQARSPGSATERAWEDLTGEEEVIASGVAGLKDGQAVSLPAGGK
jgi:RND family efflux transporter MFP subunit